MELVVYDTPEETAAGTAQRIADLMAEHGEDRFTLGLAGGSTPRSIYQALRGRATQWDKVDAWLSDERWVPPDDGRSNGRMAAETLMNHVDATFHRPPWSELLEPVDSAAHYEARLRSVLAGRRPDLILLGMGDDGHTASLFPETEALEVKDRWIVANHVPKLGEERLTATFPLLWRANMLCVIVVGEGKAQALADSLDGNTPAGRVGDGDAVVEWHVDQAAASLVS
jgi:6-phosphogluconolactonase